MTTNTNLATADSSSETADEAILEAEGLTKVYPDGTVAVDDIDFSVTRGDFCVIIGPSGCGKSTTLHSLIGKVQPTDGTVRLAGEDITHAPTYELDIGLVFQDFQLFPHKSGRTSAMGWSEWIYPRMKSASVSRRRSKSCGSTTSLIGTPGAVGRAETAGCTRSKHCPQAEATAPRRAARRP